MKAYKIKKREERRTLYIPGDPVFYFKKPKIPLRFLSSINKPNLYRPNKDWIIASQIPVVEP